jgi:hypothetical protein
MGLSCKVMPDPAPIFEDQGSGILTAIANWGRSQISKWLHFLQTSSTVLAHTLLSSLALLTFDLLPPTVEASTL